MNQLKTFENDPKVIEELGAIDNVKRQVDSLVINSPETEVKGAEIRKVIKTMLSAIEKRRKFYTVPLEDIKRAIIGKAKEISEPIIELETTIKKKQIEYHEAVEKAAAEAESKRVKEQEARDKKKADAEKQAESAETFDDMVAAEKKIQKADAAPVTAAVEVKNLVKSTGTSTSFRKVWRHVVIDAGKVPRGFMAVDNGVIRDAIRNGVRDIPGVRIYEETITAVR